MSLNLHKGARPDERFHLQIGQPTLKTWKQWGRVFRYLSWENVYLPDGSPGYWKSIWFWKLQIYWGNTKCDGTRTGMYWNNQLDNDHADRNKYVMTTTPKEMWAFRWRSRGMKPINSQTAWTDMGGL